VVRAGDPEDRSGITGAVFAGHAVRPPPHGERSG